MLVLTQLASFFGLTVQALGLVLQACLKEKHLHCPTSCTLCEVMGAKSKWLTGLRWDYKRYVEGERSEDNLSAGLCGEVSGSVKASEIEMSPT